MSEEIAISLQNISKCFKRYNHPVDRLKELLLPQKTYAQEFWALRDINLEIPKGQTVGIVGRNGSGKSTLLQIIAGTLAATTGEMNVKGRISALLELGSGFNPEFTGRQNVFFNGRLLGLSQKEVEAKFDDIASFADIGEFIEQPVKTYSSGMFVRLAFAVAINVEPEILIVDEALSVGDGVFVHRCMAKIKEFQDNNGTILFVSHDIGSVNRLCTNCFWLNEGKLVERGNPAEVSKSYQAWIYDKINQRIKSESEASRIYNQEFTNQEINNGSLEVKSQKQADSLNINPYTEINYLSFSNFKRFGTGRCEILSLSILDDREKETAFVLPGETLIIKGTIVSHDDILSPIFGISMFDRLRVSIAGWNTKQYEYQLPPLKKNQTVCVSFKFKWPHIKNDSYSLEPAIADGSQENHEMIDWIQAAVTLESGVTDLTFGFIRFTDVKVSHEFKTLRDHQLFQNFLVQ
ncbi:ABC transporter ATP-binding protein [Calothrix sp. CCY 0018]|uniref:ABC transporter ATP-binding protein n=1 Tax=Calothrix sp. CCY 0018 TaxID=3103864 RepID=UPI0039C62D28